MAKRNGGVRSLRVRNVGIYLTRPFTSIAIAAATIAATTPISTNSVSSGLVHQHQIALPVAANRVVVPDRAQSFRAPAANHTHDRPCSYLHRPIHHRVRLSDSPPIPSLPPPLPPPPSQPSTFARNRAAPRNRTGIRWRDCTGNSVARSWSPLVAAPRTCDVSQCARPSSVKPNE